MDVQKVYKKINFVERYKLLCAKFDDFENRMLGNKTELYNSIFTQLGYDLNYDKRESFYRLEEEENKLLYGMQFVLKRGIVEMMIYSCIGDDFTLPAGRADFICEELDSSFNREIYNLPKYRSSEELEIILKEIFTLYEDYKEALKEHLGSMAAPNHGKA